MNKKLMAVLMLAALIAAGASAQIMFGVQGVVPVDQNFKVQDVVDRLQNDQGVLYGFMGEIAFRTLGFGVETNVIPVASNGFSDYMIMDAKFYISYHLIKARAFLDPFIQGGVGAVAAQVVDSSDLAYGSYYWYAAAGLGINLGIIGVYTKVEYNNELTNKPMQDSMGYDLYSFSDGFGYFPAYEVTVGAKILL